MFQKLDERTFANAAYHGDLNILKWLRAQDPPCPWDEEACQLAASNGHLDMLKWLRAQDPPCPWNEWTCAAAARGGYIEVLKWLRRPHNPGSPYPWYPPCPWDAWTITNAVRSKTPNKLEIVQWLRENGCPWDDEATKFAAMNADMEMFEWLRKNGCPWRKDDCVYFLRYPYPEWDHLLNRYVCDRGHSKMLKHVLRLNHHSAPAP